MKIKTSTKAAIATFTLGFTNASMALAQVDLSTKFTSSVQTTVKNNVDPLVNIATMVIGIAAIITLAYCIFKFFRGDQQSQDLFIKVGGGAFVVAVLVYVIRQVYLTGV